MEIVALEELIFLVLFLAGLVCASSSTKPYNLPILPASLPEPVIPSDSFIPRNVWIAVRNVSDPRPMHTKPLMERNPTWTFHFYGNTEKDEFMAKYFTGTSLLWAYDILNPNIGCAKPEIWRLAVLYIYGGAYMDDDSNVQTKFDDIVQRSDKFIVGKESYDFDDRCFSDSFPLSNHSMNLRFGARNVQSLLGGKFFFNWLMFSAPRHPIITRIFEYIVPLIRSEYLGQGLIKMRPGDHRGKLLMCATTFPITHVAREIVLEGNYSEAELGLRVGEDQFKEYGAQIKAWFNDHAANHWVKVMNKHKAPYLREYAPEPDLFNGKLIQGPGQREIFLVVDGVRRGFPDFDTFVAMNFDTDNVQIVPHAIIEEIPKGDLLPHKDKSSGATKHK